jgi:hypothetical protein
MFCTSAPYTWFLSGFEGIGNESATTRLYPPVPAFIRLYTTKKWGNKFDTFFEPRLSPMHSNAVLDEPFVDDWL